LRKGVRRAASSGLDILSLSHNHGEACDISSARRTALAQRVRGEIEAAGRPAVLQMSSQELRSDAWFPLAEAIQGLPYVLVGTSAIGGRTKLLCSQVDTAVQVAVRSDVVGRVQAGVAEHCNGFGACQESSGETTRERFYIWPIKATKGHVAVHLQIGSTKLRLVSAHMDTGEFDENIEQKTGPALGRWQREAAGVAIVGADFNNRLGARASAAFCDGIALTAKKLASVFNTSAPRFAEDLRLATVQRGLLAGARSTGGAGLAAELAPPAAAGGAALPTYKFPDTLSRALVPTEVQRSAEQLFGEAEGTNVCKKDPPSIGVLDSVAVLRDPSQFALEFAGRPIWAMLPGSDHALVGHMVRIAAA